MIDNIANIINSQTRITGMASGLDTESLIIQMLRLDNLKIDRQKQQKQVLEWQMEEYRSITNKLRAFQDEYFNILKVDTNMRSANPYNKYIVKSSNENAVKAVGGPEVVGNVHTISNIKLATATTVTSSDKITNQGNELRLTDSMSQVQSKLEGQGFDYGTIKITKIENGIETEVEIEVKETDTLGSLISRINNSDAGVKIEYSQFHNKFTISSKKTGQDNKFELDSNGSNFFEAIKISSDNIIEGKNASFTLDGVSNVERSSNTFAIDGITYTLLEEVEEAVTITLTQDIDGIYENIKNFIDSYNQLIEDINSKIGEKRNKNYMPLTAAQKESMKEEDIKKWEEQAKAGWLSNDRMLENIVNQIRTALYESVDGVNLTSIGITTGRWEEKGKLIINEQRLKEAIENDAYTITNLFSKQSSTYSSYSADHTAEERKIRYEENGLMNRVFDILQDSIRTTRNKDGRKGLLIEKAGIINDTTEFDNPFTEQIKKKDRLIEDLLAKLYIKEEQYYVKFAEFERAITYMNSQSMWLAQQFGGGF